MLEGENMMVELLLNKICEISQQSGQSKGLTASLGLELESKKLEIIRLESTIKTLKLELADAQNRFKNSLSEPVEEEVPCSTQVPIIEGIDDEYYIQFHECSTTRKEEVTEKISHPCPVSLWTESPEGDCWVDDPSVEERIDRLVF